MKQFFEEYGGVIIILIVIAVLLVIVGSDGASGLSLTIKNAITAAVNKFTTVYNAIKVPVAAAAGAGA